MKGEDVTNYFMETNASQGNQGGTRSAELLRRRAEALLARSPARQSPSGDEELRQLVHEFGVHQIELEMQNDELRQTQQRLEALQQSYFDLYELAPTAYFTLDYLGTVTGVNQAGTHLLGISREKLQGRLFGDFVQKEMWDQFQDHRRRAVQTGKRQICDLVLAPPGKEPVHARLESVSRIIESSSEVLQLAVVDLTDKYRAREELVQANNLLKRQFAQTRKLTEELTYVEQRERQRIARLLHDHLQQLLVAARMRIEMARQMSDFPPESPNRHAFDEVDDLLAQCLAASRSLIMELSPPILHESGLIAALRWLARWMKELHGLNVILEEGIPPVALPENVRSILFEATRELLFNVVKHSGTHQARVQIGRLDGFLHICVSDQGKGLDPRPPEDDLPHSFGLLNIQHRLSWLQGKMSIDTAPGQGCRVTLCVPEVSIREIPPKDVARVNEPVATTAFPSRDDGQVRVLLADDHRVVREGLANTISMETGLLLVGQAATGRQAVELARQVHPDVVIMDINMPDMNGIEATRLITAEMPRVQVIGLSMHNQADMAQTMLEAGAATYFSKEEPLHTLVAAIRQYAKAHR